MNDKNKILSYIGMGSGALMIICVFLPYVSMYSKSLSLWSAESGNRVLLILAGLAVAAAYLFNKKTDLTYAVAGYGILDSITKMISNEGLNDLSIGFYLLLLVSIAMFVAAYLYDESKGVALINLTTNKSAFQNQTAQPVQPQYAQPNQFAQPAPQPEPMAQPMYAQPQPEPVQPQQVAQPEPQMQPQYNQPQPMQPNQFNYNNNQNGNQNM